MSWYDNASIHGTIFIICTTGLLNKAQHRQRLHIVSGLSVTFSPSRFLKQEKPKYFHKADLKLAVAICGVRYFVFCSFIQSRVKG